MSPTYQHVWESCDTIVAQTPNTIFEKLYFSVIISSVIDPKLKRPLLGLPKETYQNWNQRKIGDYIIYADTLQVVTM
jgi:hypothetical protein